MVNNALKVSDESVSRFAPTLHDGLRSPRRGGRGEAVILPCDTPVELEVPYPSGTWITVEIGGRRVAETLARVPEAISS